MMTYNVNEINLILELIPQLEKISSKIDSDENISKEELETILIRISYFEGAGIKKIDECSEIIREYCNKKYK